MFITTICVAFNYAVDHLRLAIRIGLMALFAWCVPVLTAQAQGTQLWEELTQDQREQVMGQVNKELQNALSTIWNEREADRLAADRARILGRETGKGPKPEKTLGMLIQEYENGLEGNGDKSASSFLQGYVKMAGEAVVTNPKTFAVYAGELSAGDYSRVAKSAPGWGATAFAILVRDYLDANDYEIASTVWGKAVTNASTLKSAGIKLMQGDYAGASKDIQTTAKSKSQDATKRVIVEVMDWMLDGAGIKANDFIDGASKSASISPGEVYIAIIEAEIKAIEAFSTFTAEYFTQDYFLEYANFRLKNYSPAGARGQMVHLAPGTGWADVRNAAKSASIDPEKLEYIYLEDCYQKHRISSLSDLYKSDGQPQNLTCTPMSQWAKDWANKRAADAAEAARLEGGLTEVGGQHSDAAQAFSRAMTTRIRELAREQLSDAQRKDLDEKDKTEKAETGDALADLAIDVDGFVNRYQAVLANCEAFKTAASEMQTARDSGSAISLETSSLMSRLEQIDVSTCSAQSAAGAGEDLEGLLSRVKDAAQDMTALRDGAIAEQMTVCAAPPSIRRAASKSAARAKLDEALSSANAIVSAQDAMDTVLAAITGAHEDAARAADRALQSPATDGTGAKLAALASEAQAVKTRYDGLNNGRFPSAKTRADAALKTASARLPSIPTTPFKNRGRTEQAVLDVLWDMKKGVRGAEATALRDRLTDIKARAGVCNDNMGKEWETLKYKSLYSGIKPEILIGLVEQKRAQCPSAIGSGVDPKAIKSQARAAYDKGLKTAVSFNALAADAESCVPQALTSYNEAWLNEDDDTDKSESDSDSEAEAETVSTVSLTDVEGAILACDMDRARTLADQIGDPVEQGAAYKLLSNETKAAALMAEANKLLGSKKKFDRAYDVFQQAFDTTKCPQTQRQALDGMGMVNDRNEQKNRRDEIERDAETERQMAKAEKKSKKKKGGGFGSLLGAIGGVAEVLEQTGVDTGGAADLLRASGLGGGIPSPTSPDVPPRETPQETQQVIFPTPSQDPNCIPNKPTGLYDTDFIPGCTPGGDGRTSDPVPSSGSSSGGSGYTIAPPWAKYSPSACNAANPNSKGRAGEDCYCRRASAYSNQTECKWSREDITTDIKLPPAPSQSSGGLSNNSNEYYKVSSDWDNSCQTRKPGVVGVSCWCKSGLWGLPDENSCRWSVAQPGG